MVHTNLESLKGSIYVHKVVVSKISNYSLKRWEK